MRTLATQEWEHTWEHTGEYTGEHTGEHTEEHTEEHTDRIPQLKVDSEMKRKVDKV